MKKHELIERLSRKFPEAVVRAFSKVPREVFVPPSLRDYAYDDTALPIGRGQTISQPSVIAEMLTLAELFPGAKVLEVGTGSGYTAALTYEITRAPVYTVERDPFLAKEAERRLHALGYKEIHVFVGDGSEGLPDYAPYDRIIIHAAAPNVPPPLVDQLKEGGIIVLPEGDRYTQRLRAYRKREGRIVLEREGSFVVFVPLVGKHGFREA